MENYNNESILEQYQLQRELGNEALANKYMTELLENNKNLVNKLVNKACSCGLRISHEDKEDLYQEGMIALMEAVRTYDGSKAAFITYAYQKVHYAIKDWLRDNHLVAIPNKKQSDCRGYILEFEKYKASHQGKMPSDEEMATMMKKKQADIIDIKSALSILNVDSLDRTVTYGDSESPLVDTIADTRDPYKIIEMRITLDQGLKMLQQKEREILEMYYYQGLCLAEIAEKLNVTPQYVFKIKKKALKHLAKLQNGEAINTQRGIRA